MLNGRTVAVVLCLAGLVVGSGLSQQRTLANDWNDFLHFTKIGRFDLAKGYGQAILQGNPDPVALLELTQANPQGYELAMKVVDTSNDPELASVAKQLLAVIEQGRFELRSDPQVIVDEIKRLASHFGEPLFGLFGFRVPDLPAWAVTHYGIGPSPWGEILPLLGWAAGGFASQVWYTYWVLGAGYGMARGKHYGQPLDPDELRQIDAGAATRLRGWCRVVYVDATLALLIGVTVTGAFMVAGAGVLGPAEIAPDGSKVALELSRLFSDRWGALGAHLFILAGLAAMISTMLGQFAGWPRLLADCFRLLVPRVGRYSWAQQFRFILVCYAISNMLIVYTFGLTPVFLVKLGAILDGLLLTPLQALAVGLVLYLVMPRFFAEDARRILKPSPVFAVGLLLAFVVFGYFCVARFPETIAMK